MKELKQNQTVLARLITKADIKQGMNFFSEDTDFVQIGVWKDLEKGKEGSPHIHNAVKKETNRTHEVLYIIEGSIEVLVYDLDKSYIGQLEAHQGDIVMLLECGHGYIVKEDNTTMLEFKNGPYLGAAADRYRI